MSVGLQSQAGEASAAVGRDRLRILVCTADASAEGDLVALFAARGATVHVAADHAGYASATARDQFDAVLVDLPSTITAESRWREDVMAEQVGRGGLVLAVPPDRDGEGAAAMEQGAMAWLTKPCTAAQAAAVLLLAAENRRLTRRLRALEARRSAEVAELDPVSLIGCSPAVRRLSGVISRAGMNDATVLIEGKPGVGKSLVAELIHRGGHRQQEPFLPLDCEGLDEAALENALSNTASGSIVFEDVERLSTRCQSRLVRHLKENSGEDSRSVRILATTAARLAELTARNAFREDLYYRLNMFPIVVPSLTERREDIPLLARHFLARSAVVEGLPDRGFTPGAMILLEAHPWPGNTAQLQQAVLRAHQLADGGPIDRVHLFGPSTGVAPPPDVQGLTDRVSGVTDAEDELNEDDIRPFQEEEKALLARALRATKGNVRRAAQLLGIGRATLYRKIQVYQLRLN